MVDGQVHCEHGDCGSFQGPLLGVYLDIPVSAYSLIASDASLQELLRRAFRAVGHGWCTSQQQHEDTENYFVELRMQLLNVEEGWQKVVRNQIANAKGSNQALITEKLATERGRPELTWNELRYASKSEVRIAQALEDKKVLFFPLAVGVRADTGTNYKDHREVDFLICNDGVWGVLEVSYHPGRYEQDKEKDSWFKRSGILCIEHYTAEQCYQYTEKVVNEFLEHLAKYKR
jgi:hypothetical protein